ncbi:MAG: hypothetical protein JXB88_15060 [Spirochaetales bacterium]|nr:hypothetical protein [Spirochaetales bacterium]
MMKVRFFLVSSFTLVLLCFFTSCNLFISLFDRYELVIQPHNTSIEMSCEGLHYYAIKQNAGNGFYEDVTEHVNWTSSNRAVAIISPDGFASPVNPGVVTISAEYENMKDKTSLSIGEFLPDMDPLQPDWARSSITAGNRNTFNNVKTDGNGNIYACGYIFGTGTYNFGGVDISGTSSSENCLLIKYAPDGSVIWSKTIVSGTGSSPFYAMAFDSSNDVYVVGNIYGTGTFDFGDGVTVEGMYSAGYSLLIIKYDSNGTARWAQSVVSGNNYSSFYGVDVDNNGNVYAAGAIKGNSPFTIGPVPVTGPSVTDNILIVKFNSNGTVLWAKTLLAGTNISKFSEILYNGGNIYCIGYIYGTSGYDFGTGVISGQGTNSNAVLVKYAPDGTVLWAKTTVAGAYESIFNCISGDNSGNIYVGGYIKTTGNYDFGCGIINGTASGNNAVLVRYNSAGAAVWARTVSEGSNYSGFNASVYSKGYIYTAGSIYSTDSYNFGCGLISGSYSQDNAVIVKYDSYGNAITARTVSAASNQSIFYGLSCDSTGRLYAAGAIYGNTLYDFGYSITVNGVYSSYNNVVLVRYWP